RQRKCSTTFFARSGFQAKKPNIFNRGLSQNAPPLFKLGLCALRFDTQEVAAVLAAVQRKVMADSEWLKLLTAALGGGLTVKISEIVYQEIRRRSERTQSAQRFVDDHLDPLLKAADELVGKLRSLADEDFRSLQDVDQNSQRLENHDFRSLLFLLAKLWANIEIFRREGLSVAVARSVRGNRLLNFIDCMESRRVRIVDRMSQRAIGELLLSRRDGVLETGSFTGFVRILESDAESRRWIAPVAHVLSRTRHTSERQRVLQYGIVLHAMIDTLDTQHYVTRDRPSYSNKLSRKSWRDIKYRVFGTYLSFVPQPEKYLGPPKKGRP
ncbi:MAG: hypothetical protein H7841_17190, partial [Magnetospirillum sp. WYHS-4]